MSGSSSKAFLNAMVPEPRKAQAEGILETLPPRPLYRSGVGTVPWPPRSWRRLRPCRSRGFPQPGLLA